MNFNLTGDVQVPYVRSLRPKHIHPKRVNSRGENETGEKQRLNNKGKLDCRENVAGKEKDWLPETDQQRVARLEGMRALGSERLDAEPPEQKESQLERMSTCQMERLVAETEPQREARLDRISALWSERLAAESSEQNNAIMQVMTSDYHTTYTISDFITNSNSFNYDLKCTYWGGLPQMMLQHPL